MGRHPRTPPCPSPRPQGAAGHGRCGDPVPAYAAAEGRGQATGVYAAAVSAGNLNGGKTVVRGGGIECGTYYSSVLQCFY